MSASRRAEKKTDNRAVVQELAALGDRLRLEGRGQPVADALAEASRSMSATMDLIGSLSARMTLASRAAAPTALTQLTSALAEAISPPDLSSVARVLAGSQAQASLAAGKLADPRGRQTAMSQLASIGSAAFAAHQARLLGGDLTPQLALPAKAARRVQEWSQRSADAFRLMAQGMRRDLDSARSRLPEVTVRTGWVMPLRDEAPRFLSELAALADATPGEARRALRHLYDPSGQRFRGIVKGLPNSPILGRHRVAVRQGLAALRNQHYYAAVCTLLPLVESALHEVVWADDLPSGQTTMKGAWKEAKGRHTAATEVANTESFSWLFSDLSFALLEGLLEHEVANHPVISRFDRSAIRLDGRLNRALNRNAILHGASTAYGRRDNAVRVTLLLAATCEMRVPAASEPQ